MMLMQQDRVVMLRDPPEVMTESEIFEKQLCLATPRHHSQEFKDVMSGEYGEILTTMVDSTMLEQQTTAAPVTATEPSGAEGEAQTRDSWVPVPTWAEPTCLLTPNPRSERFMCDGARQCYGRSSQEEPECICIVEDTEAECLFREFRGEVEEIRREMQNMMLDIPAIIMEANQQELWNHEWVPDGTGRAPLAPP
ncbi:UNVERIFIED_CONTAM: hypothetical protein K2H54_047899 [Gekko kuhli]